MSPVITRARTSTGAGVIAILVLVLAFGNQAYAEWADKHARAPTPGICSCGPWPGPVVHHVGRQRLRDVIAFDIRALLLVVLVAAIIGMAGGQRRRRRRRLHPGLVLGDHRRRPWRRCSPRSSPPSLALQRAAGAACGVDLRTVRRVGSSASSPRPPDGRPRSPPDRRTLHVGAPPERGVGRPGCPARAPRFGVPDQSGDVRPLVCATVDFRSSCDPR